jgi:hypothetical protein
MRRRHEALIDDRESVERDHQVCVFLCVCVCVCTYVYVFIYTYTYTHMIYIVCLCVCISVERDRQGPTEPSTSSLRPHTVGP